MIVIEKLFSQPELNRVRQALQAIEVAGGKAYLVGGAVRDLLLDRVAKDSDIEVHYLSLEELEKVLQAYGVVNQVGKFFGVLKWEHSAIDWSIPRRDFAGRRPDVELNPAMGIKQALRRRDLTINAMALDLATGDLIDPFNGQSDLSNRVARSPDIKFFAEDPLRFYRVMQFIARFELVPDAELNELCRTMEIASVSVERIEAEFDKLFLLARSPSRGIRWVAVLGRLSEVLPELAATVGILQRYDWHPEGDVFEHTMQAIDAAAQLEYDSQYDKLLIVSAALCHDLGKAISTFIRDGRIRSTGHDIEGVPLAKSLMSRLTHHKKRRASVAKLVWHHMAPGLFVRNNASDAAYRRLAVKLAPDVNCYLLSLLAEADMRGRNPVRGSPLPGPIPAVVQFREHAERVGVLYGPVPFLLVGADLLDVLSPGPELGKVLKRAYDLQINENITDKSLLKKRALAVLKR